MDLMSADERRARYQFSRTNKYGKKLFDWEAYSDKRKRSENYLSVGKRSVEYEDY